MEQEKPVNPFAIGGAFIERFVQIGWLSVKKEGRKKFYYLTDKGVEGLRSFGIDSSNLYYHPQKKTIEKRLKEIGHR
ncbi:MAG: hypothetical protein H3Z53_00395 [archaeon]|nr:hypothetical protein [archaeon]MCP8312823.1 hypothetical protein [archaeon]MCP8315276.1 hypothetical protein [archaeon]